jgi:hypothetical protein
LVGVRRLAGDPVREEPTRGVRRGPDPPRVHDRRVNGGLRGPSRNPRRARHGHRAPASLGVRDGQRRRCLGGGPVVPMVRPAGERRGDGVANRASGCHDQRHDGDPPGRWPRGRFRRRGRERLPRRPQVHVHVEFRRRAGPVPRVPGFFHRLQQPEVGLRYVAVVARMRGHARRIQRRRRVQPGRPAVPWADVVRANLQREVRARRRRQCCRHYRYWERCLRGLERHHGVRVVVVPARLHRAARQGHEVDVHALHEAGAVDHDRRGFAGGVQRREAPERGRCKV